MSNKRNWRGSSMWVCLLQSVGSSDVVNVWVWVTVGIAALCWCLLNVSEGVYLISEVSVAALCGCVSCGLCVPLMWSMCGCGLQWALRLLAGVYWPGGRL